MPPVEVPAIRSKRSAVGRPVRRSISASTRAGIRPRMPPPSIASTFTGAKTRDPPDLRAARVRQAAVTMTHLPKRLLILGSVAACVLGAAQPAAAQVQPAGTGEPAYTSSQQNKQFFEWPSSSGIDAYQVQFSYYENNSLKASPSYSAPNGATNYWADWDGVGTLAHGSTYGICAQGRYSLPNDPLFFADGPNSCSMGTM